MARAPSLTQGICTNLQVLYTERDVEAGLHGVGSRDADVVDSVDGREVLQPARVGLQFAYERY